MIEAIQVVKAIVEAMTYGFDHSIPLVTQVLVPPIKVTIQRQVLEEDAKTSASPKDNSVQIDFSKLALNEVYEIQQAATFEIRIRENVVAYQETKQQRKEKLCKALLKEKRNNYMGASPFLLKKNRKY